MDSDEEKQKHTKEKIDPIAEYCQKFSQFKDLPKYFCGTSVSYMPNALLVKDEVCKPPAVVITEIKEERPHSDGEGDQWKNVSPSSSITSNKKLEWDNGADIGYDNYSKNLKQRSLSLPSLLDLEPAGSKVSQKLDNVSEVSLERDSARVIPITSTSGSSDVIDDKHKTVDSSISVQRADELTVTASSSSGEVPQEPEHVTSTSSNSDHSLHRKPLTQIYSSSESSSEAQKILDFSNTLAYLKKKIGEPNAKSTPINAVAEARENVEEYSETPVVKRQDKRGKVLSEKFLKNVKITKASDHFDAVAAQAGSNSKSKISSSCEDLSFKNKKLLRKIHSQENLLARPSNIKISKKQVINLCRTKPMSLECLDVKKPVGNKKIQTSLNPKKVTTGTQTDKIDEKSLINIIQSSTLMEEQQNIIYIEFSDSNPSAKTRSSVAQTDLTSVVSTSNGGSFEYMSGCEYLQTENKENISSNATASTSDSGHLVASYQSSHLKRSEAKQDLRHVTSDESAPAGSSSKNLPLGDLITAKQSEKLLVDVQKSVMLLQKLIKSKKYDDATKKHYVKKIVGKLVDMKYLEESSTSSELFFPRKGVSKLQIEQSAENKTVSNSSSENAKQSVIQKNSLRDNIPWYPAETSAVLKSKFPPRKQKKLHMKNQADEIPFEEEDKEKILLKQTSRQNKDENYLGQEDSALKRHPHLTLSDDSGKQRPHPISSTSSDKTPEYLSLGRLINRGKQRGNVPANRQLKTSTTSSSGPERNWREDKTYSEKLLEERKSIVLAQGDHLVQYAKKERNHQISWINNEIDHLSKLKFLLEKNSSKELLNWNKNNGNVGDMKGVQKTTTVYMVEDCTERNSQATSKYCSVQNSRPSSSKSGRNFIIHTELTDNTTSDEYNFCVQNDSQQKNYVCKKILPGHQKPPIIGDIKVTTTDSTTDIKVTAKRSDRIIPKCQKINEPCCSCLQTPCICSCGFVPKEPSLVGPQCTTFPRSATETRFSKFTSDRFCAAAFQPPKSSSSNQGSDSKPSVRCTVEIPVEENKPTCACQKDPCICKVESKTSAKTNSCPKLTMSEPFKVDIKPKPCLSKNKQTMCMCKRNSSSCTCRKNKRATKSVDFCECSSNDSDGKQSSKIDVYPCTSRGSSAVSTKNSSSKVDGCMCKSKKTHRSMEKCTCCKVDKCTCGSPLCNCDENLQTDRTCKSSGQSQTQQSSTKVECSGPDKVSRKCNTKSQTQVRYKNKNCSCETPAACICDEPVQTQSDSRGKDVQCVTSTICICSEPAQTQSEFRRKDVPCETPAVCVCNEPVQISLTEGKPREVCCETAAISVCSEPVQTQRGGQDKNVQCDECKFKNEDQQTPVTVCTDSNQQALVICSDEDVQSACLCKDVEVQTACGPMRDENLQTLRKLTDKKSQADCKCVEKSLQCSCRNATSACQTETGIDENIETLPDCYCPTSEGTDVELIQCREPKRCSTGEESSSESSSSESSESFVECVCCKRKNAPPRFAELRDKLDRDAQPLCHPCMRQNMRMPWAQFSNPNHICKCYTVVGTSTFNEIKKTIQELDCMEQLENYCTCPDIKNKKSAKYCSYCKCKLQNVEKNKNGIAYMLKFDFEKPSKKKKKRHKSPRKLEEITIKVPYPYHKKKHKDKENEKRKEYKRVCFDPASTESTSSKNTGLQECLQMNRPDFIENIEKRRRIIVDCKSQREENKELKKLLYLKEHPASAPAVKIENPKSTRFFTDKEMKEINRRNYKKLPEVQQKLVDNKNRQLKQANRLIAEQFNEKLRAQVLKGKRSLPTDVNVVTLVCTKQNK